MVNNLVEVECTATVLLNKHTAPLLMELLTKAAVAGPSAKYLADLYAQVEAANEVLKGS